MEVSSNVRYVVKKGIMLPALGNLVESFHSDKQEVLLCWDELENLGKDVNKFYQLLSVCGDTAVSADVGKRWGSPLKV